jgi:hypothetical protein
MRGEPTYPPKTLTIPYPASSGIPGIFVRPRRVVREFAHGNPSGGVHAIQLWSAITGTRPGVLLSQKNASLADTPLGKRKRDKTFQSDLPKPVSVERTIREHDR